MRAREDRLLRCDCAPAGLRRRLAACGRSARPRPAPSARSAAAWRAASAFALAIRTAIRCSTEARSRVSVGVLRLVRWRPRRPRRARRPAAGPAARRPRLLGAAALELPSSRAKVSPRPPGAATATFCSSSACRACSAVSCRCSAVQPVDLGLRRCRTWWSTTAAGSPGRRGRVVDHHRDRQQVGLLLVLVADHLAGHLLLRVELRLPGATAALALARSAWACFSLAAIAMSRGLRRGELALGLGQRRPGAGQPGAGLLDRRCGGVQRRVGLVEVVLGLGDLLA